MDFHLNPVTIFKVNRNTKIETEFKILTFNAVTIITHKQTKVPSPGCLLSI